MQRQFIAPGAALEGLDALARESGFAREFLQPWLELLRDVVCPELGGDRITPGEFVEMIGDLQACDDAALLARMGELPSDLEVQLVAAAIPLWRARTLALRPQGEAIYVALGLLDGDGIKGGDVQFLRSACAAALEAIKAAMGRGERMPRDRSTSLIASCCAGFWTDQRGAPPMRTADEDGHGEFFDFVQAVATMLMLEPPRDVRRTTLRVLDLREEMALLVLLAENPWRDRWPQAWDSQKYVSWLNGLREKRA